VGADLFKLSSQEIQDCLDGLSDRSSQEISLEYKMPMDLAESIEAYLIVLKNFFDIINKKYIYILRTSLSEAILASMFSDTDFVKRYDKQNQLVAAAVNLCHRYNLDLQHAKYVASLSEKFFDAFKDHLGLTAQDSLYLIIAAYLHDIGTFINNRAHHKHSEYIISGLNFFRLTDEEVKMIACISRYHRRSTPQRTHPLYHSLPVAKRILVQKLSSLLRMANALDSSHKQKIKNLDICFKPKGQVTVSVSTYENFSLERINFEHKKVFFEEITGNKVRLIAREAVR
jgi:exopolyphosphatase / guanosine-5'-triphosphate,3'-diphosphate pyrophosphatase